MCRCVAQFTTCEGKRQAVTRRISAGFTDDYTNYEGATPQVSTETYSSYHSPVLENPLKFFSTMYSLKKAEVRRRQGRVLVTIREDRPV